MTHTTHAGSKMRHKPRDYAQTPLNIYWEMTQACALACRHCRAEAMPQPHPWQLSYEEGVGLIHQILEFGDPLPQLILTGGDPLSRPDLFELIDRATELGISVSITPSATPTLTYETMVRLKKHGVQGLGLSLDGPNAKNHDAIRGIDGCFDLTMQAIRWAGELDLPLQINTLVAAETAVDLPATYELLKQHKVMRWGLFFLISVGRGRVLQPLSPEASEDLMHWVYDTAKDAPFVVATTEAPSYRRVALDRMRSEGMTPEQIRRSPAYRGFNIRDGNGIMFISNTGDICPAGFLPLTAGNVRKDSVANVYRNSDVFSSLHNPAEFKGKCGVCEHRVICGGSRSRAFAATNDPLESDPLCPYEPQKSA
ncbi:MAG: TIGR04053 family radical SAM/SPASM domain-containing protein [Chloroflexota bacterium]